MKWSHYNFAIDNLDGRHVIFNCRTAEIMAIVPELRQLVDEHIDHLDDLQNIHPEFYAYLVGKKFVVGSIGEEQQGVMDSIQMANNSKNFYNLVINPTMDCNLKCWYCYESHVSDSIMTEEVRKSIELLIEQKGSEYKTLQLSFFGGEPLMRFDTSILPIIEYAVKVCDQTGCNLPIMFTTNATLLDKKKIDRLATLGKKVFFQVPFDGNREKHNKIKRLPGNDKSAYDISIENIKYALSKGMTILVRCNYSEDTAEGFEDLIDEFSDVDEKWKDNLSFMFKKIWQAEDSEGMKKLVGKMGERVAECGIKNMSLINEFSDSVCYADTPNGHIINYDGNVFKCTARDFVKEIREGVLNTDGTISFNERYDDRMECKFINDSCLKCKILPLCKGGCTQHQLEAFEENVCPLGMTEEDKYEAMVDRVSIMTNKADAEKNKWIRKGD